jgi:hypothetical protein
MVLPRPALIAIVGGVLLLAVFALTRVTGQAEEKPASAPAPAPAAQAPEASESKPAAAQAEETAREASDGLPAAVERALARKRVFVLLFTQDGSDDKATRAAVDELDGVEVFKADIAKIGDYRRVISELGINQAPAVVIVDRQGQAQLFEGYTDAGSLAQQVEDAK